MESKKENEKIKEVKIDKSELTGVSIKLKDSNSCDIVLETNNRKFYITASESNKDKFNFNFEKIRIYFGKVLSDEYVCKISNSQIGAIYIYIYEDLEKSDKLIDNFEFSWGDISEIIPE